MAVEIGSLVIKAGFRGGGGSGYDEDVFVQVLAKVNKAMRDMQCEFRGAIEAEFAARKSADPCKAS